MTIPDYVQMQHVTSSMIKEVGYDEESLHLYVTFFGGKKGAESWRYDGVTNKVYEQLMAAASIGKYFLSNIRGHYTAHKL